jgi:hypothetical protein
MKKASFTGKCTGSPERCFNPKTAVVAIIHYSLDSSS